jgi:hypothetical protein
MRNRRLTLLCVLWVVGCERNVDKDSDDTDVPSHSKPDTDDGIDTDAADVDTDTDSDSDSDTDADTDSDLVRETGDTSAHTGHSGSTEPPPPHDTAPAIHSGESGGLEDTGDDTDDFDTDADTDTDVDSDPHTDTDTSVPPSDTGTWIGPDDHTGHTGDTDGGGGGETAHTGNTGSPLEVEQLTGLIWGDATGLRLHVTANLQGIDSVTNPPPDPLFEIPAGAAWSVTVTDQPDHGRCTATTASGIGVETPFEVHCLSVLPRFEAAGKGWHAWVARQTEDACVPDGSTAWNSCEHVGAFRTLELHGMSACDDLTWESTLDVIAWECLDDGGHAVLHSTGLKPDAGLTDLIDFDAGEWKDPALTVSWKGHTLPTHRRWWSDQVVSEAPWGAIENTVFAVATLDQFVTSSNVDRVSMVVDPSLGVHSGARFSVYGADFVWVEGAFSSDTDKPVELTTVRVARLENVSTVGGRLALVDANAATLQHIRIAHAASSGLHLNDVTSARLHDVVIANGADVGVVIENSSDVAMVRATLYDHEAEQIRVASSSDVSLVDVVTYATWSQSINVVESDGIVISGFTSIGGSGVDGASVQVRDSDAVLVHSTVAWRGVAGLNIGSSTNVLAVDYAVGESTLFLGTNVSGEPAVEGLALKTPDMWPCSEAYDPDWYTHCASWAPTDADFSDAFVGIVTQDDLTNPHDIAGVIDYDESSDWWHFDNPYRTLAEWPDANLVWYFDHPIPSLPIDGWTTDWWMLPMSSMPSFAFLYTETTTPNTVSCSRYDGYVPDFQASIEVLILGNAGDTMYLNNIEYEGPALPGDYTAWFPEPQESIDHFEVCMEKGAGGGITCAGIEEIHLHPTHTCELGEACNIFDASLKATDTVLRNRFGLPTGDDVVTLKRDGVMRSYLRWAQELIGDGVGNDDGLCDAGEDCVHMPNLGAYQGHGELVGPLATTTGTVADVRLFGWESNGR